MHWPNLPTPPLSEAKWSVPELAFYILVALTMGEDHWRFNLFKILYTVEQLIGILDRPFTTKAQYVSLVLLY